MEVGLIGGCPHISGEIIVLLCGLAEEGANGIIILQVTT